MNTRESRISDSESQTKRTKNAGIGESRFGFFTQFGQRFLEL